MEDCMKLPTLGRQLINSNVPETDQFGEISKLEFYQELLSVIDAFEKFDIHRTYDLSVIKARAQNVTRQGTGAFVNTTVVKCDFKVFPENMNDIKYDSQMDRAQFVSVLTTDEFERDPLKGIQLVIRHQRESMGALHTFLSHPLDVIDLVHDVNIEVFPHYLQRLRTHKDNRMCGKGIKTWTEDEKETMVKEAERQFEKYKKNHKNLQNPREKMFDNELCLVTFLKCQLKRESFKYHQFYITEDVIKNYSNYAHIIEKIRPKYRAVFKLKTIWNENREVELACCLSTEKGIKSGPKATVYEIPGKIARCYDLITCFLY